MSYERSYSIYNRFSVVTRVDPVLLRQHIHIYGDASYDETYTPFPRPKLSAMVKCRF